MDTGNRWRPKRVVMTLTAFVTSRTMRFLFPTGATVIFLALFTHTSEFPVVLGRYSWAYTILLFLYGLNVVFFWRCAVRHISFNSLVRRICSRPFLPFLVTILSIVLLVDFVDLKFPRSSADWVVLALLAGVIVQVEGLKARATFMSSNLALMSCSLVLTLVLVEVLFVLALAESRTPKSTENFVKLMLGKGKPPGFSSDEPAWLSPIPPIKPLGAFRILGLSDSFGTAGGRHNYHYLIENMLNGDMRKPIQMVNVSVPAYEPKHQLRILEFAMNYSPDLVVHGFFVGNDFSSYGGDLYKFSGVGARRRESSSPFRPRNFLLRNWLGNVVKYFADQWQRRTEKAEGIVTEIGTFSKEAFLGIQYRRTMAWGLRGQKHDDRRKNIFPVLDAIRREVEKHGARYVLVIHPDQTQVDEELRKEIVNRFQVDERDYDYELPQKLLGSYCKERGIPCLDLLPIFRERGRNGNLYLLRNTHYNEAGNRLAAIAIRAFLEREQLLPETSIEKPEEKEPRLQ